MDPTGDLGLARRLSGRLAPVAVGIGVLIGLGNPALYYLLEITALQRRAEIHARELGTRMQAALLQNPSRWRYQAQKYERVLQEMVSRVTFLE